MPSGEQLVSTTATTGIPSLLASAIASCFFVHVDDENQVRTAAHFADTAKGCFKFALVTFHAKTFFFGQTIKARLRLLVDCLRRWMDLETVCQLVSVPPSQRWFM